MIKCVNIQHPDFRTLMDMSGLDSLKLSGMMGVWMEQNDTDEWPTLNQLGVTNKRSDVYNRQQVADLMIADLDPEVKDTMREEFLSLPISEFNEMAKSIGLNFLSPYWTSSTIFPKKIESRIKPDMDFINKKMSQIDAFGYYTDKSGAKIKMVDNNNPVVWEVERSNNEKNVLFDYPNNKKTYTKHTLKKATDIANELRTKYKDTPLVFRVTKVTDGSKTMYIVRTEYPKWNEYFEKRIASKPMPKEVEDTTYYEETKELEAISNAEIQEINSLLSDIKEGALTVEQIMDRMMSFSGYNSSLTPLLDILKTKLAFHPELNVKVSNPSKDPDLYRTYALYDTDDSSITINEEVFKYGFFANVNNLVRAFSHELVHAFTVASLLKNEEDRTQEEKDFVKTITRLYNSARSQTKYKSDQTYDNVAEFISGILTSARIMEEVKGMKMSLWDRFKNAIRKLFGLPVDGKSIYDESFNAIVDHIQTSINFTYSGGNIFPREIEDEYFLQKTNPTHIDIWKALNKIDKDLEFTDSTHTYIHKPSGEEFESVTTIIDALKLGSNIEAMTEEQKEKMSRGANIGTTVHASIEDHLKRIEKAVEAETGFKMSDSAKKNLLKILAKFKKEGSTILSEVRVFDPTYKIAGTIDMIIIDSKGDVHIYDFKNKEKGFTYWATKNLVKGGFALSNRDRARTQLSVYKNMLEKIIGKQVSSMNAILLQPTIEKDLITNVQLDTNFINDPAGIDTLHYSPYAKHIYNYAKNKNSNLDFTETITEEEQDVERREELIREKAEALLASLDVLDAREIVLNKMIKSLLNKKANLYRQGNRTDIERMDKLIENLLSEKDIEKRINLILTNINKETLRILNEQKAFKDKGLPVPVYLLSAWYEFVSGYDSINELANLLTSEYGPKGGPQYRSILRQAIESKDFIKSLYTTQGIDQIVDWLTPYYNRFYAEKRLNLRKEYRKRKKLGEIANVTEEQYINSVMNDYEVQKDLKQQTKEFLHKEIKRAGGDINSLYRWMDNVLDTADPVAAAMIKAFVMTDEKARIENMLERDRAVDMARELEKFYSNSSIVPKSFYDMYKFMLEHDDKGNPTGHILTRFKSSMWDEYRKEKKFARDSFNTPDEIREYLRIWLNENAPLNSEAFNTFLWTYIDSMLEGEKISYEEYTNLSDNSAIKSNRRSYSEMVNDGLLNKEASDEILNWIADNSWSYRNPIEKWENEEYDALEKILKDKSDPRATVYEYLIKVRQKADRQLPFTFRLETRLPGVVKQFDERLRGGDSPLTILKEGIKNEFTFTANDTYKNREIITESGQAKYFMPIHFTGRITKEVPDLNPDGSEKTDDEGNVIMVKTFDEDRQSFNLIGIYYKYATMANEYWHKAQILPEMEMTKHFISTREQTRSNLSKRLNKKKKVSTANEPDKLQEQISEGYIGKSELADQIHDWFMAIVYGQKENSVAQEGEIDKAKIVNFINKYTSLNLLGVNFISGTANVLLGETLQRIESFAGEYMNPKNFAKADKFYAKNLGSTVGDIGSRAPRGLATKLLERFGVLDEYGHTDFERQTVAGQLMTTDTLYFTSRMGEHYMQSRFLFGMLDTVRAYNNEGEDIGSILDNYKVIDGNLVLNSEVNINKSNWTEKDIFNFTYKVRGILSRLHGEYSNLGRVAIQRMAIGRMAYMFRKFVIPGFKRRWGKKQYIERLGDFVEGNYITSGKFIGSVGHHIFGKTEDNSELAFFARLMDNLSHFRFALWAAEWESLSDHEKANIRRTISELAFLTVALVIASIAGKQLADDDDDDEFFWAFISYQMLRFKAELLFYSPKLDEAMSILRSPMASMSVIENIIKLTGQIFDPMEVYENGPYKGRPKIFKTLMDMTPVQRQFYRLKNIEDQSKWFKQ